PAAAARLSLEASLTRLGRDHVDLIQLHNSLGGSSGLARDEMAGMVAHAMQSLVAAGFARHCGITGLGEPDDVTAAVTGGRFETVQCYFNALNPSAGFAGAGWGSTDFGGVIDTAAGRGVGVINIRVMAAGAVSGTSDRAANASPITGAA